MTKRQISDFGLAKLLKSDAQHFKAWPLDSEENQAKSLDGMPLVPDDYEGLDEDIESFSACVIADLISSEMKIPGFMKDQFSEGRFLGSRAIERINREMQCTNPTIILAQARSKAGLSALVLLDCKSNLILDQVSFARDDIACKEFIL